MKKKIIFIVAILSLLVSCIVLSLFFERKNIYNNYEFAAANPSSYVCKSSYDWNDTINLYFNSNEEVKANLYRLSDELVPVDSFILEGVAQSSVYSPKSGYMWNRPYKMKINDTTGGYFVLKLENSQSVYFQPIIQRAKNAAEIAVISSYCTWQAYNICGGKSKYHDNITSSTLQNIFELVPAFAPKKYIPFNRPFSFMKKDFFNKKLPKEKLSVKSGLVIDSSLYDSQDYKPNYDTIQTNSQFLAGEWNLTGFLEENKFKYNVYTDYEFSNNTDIFSAKLIVFHVHSEYWSDEMIGNLIDYVRKGGKVIFASGNNMYRKIVFNEFGYTVKENMISSSETRNVLGTYYTNITYPLKANFKVVDEDHWIFEGINIKKGDEFGMQGSGGETDQMGFGSEEFNLLAVGTNIAGPAQMVIKENANEGWIFNSSSMTFSETIPRDTVVQKMLQNLILRALK